MRLRVGAVAARSRRSHYEKKIPDRTTGSMTARPTRAAHRATAGPPEEARPRYERCDRWIGRAWNPAATSSYKRQHQRPKAPRVDGLDLRTRRVTSRPARAGCESARTTCPTPRGISSWKPWSQRRDESKSQLRRKLNPAAQGQGRGRVPQGHSTHLMSARLEDSDAA